MLLFLITVIVLKSVAQMYYYYYYYLESVLQSHQVLEPRRRRHRTRPSCLQR